MVMAFALWPCPRPSGMRGQRWLCPLLTPAGRELRYGKGGSLSWFCVSFFLLLKKWSLFALVWSRGSCWCPALLLGQVSTGALALCSSGAGLASPIHSDPLEKSRILTLPFKLQERLVFFTKLNLIFSPPPKSYLEMAVSISLYNLLFEIRSLLVLGQQFWALSVYFPSANKQNVIFWFSKSKGFWFHPTSEALQAAGGSYLVLCELVAVPSWP